VYNVLGCIIRLLAHLSHQMMITHVETVEVTKAEICQLLLLLLILLLLLLLLLLMRLLLAHLLAIKRGHFVWKPVVERLLIVEIQHLLLLLLTTARGVLLWFLIDVAMMLLQLERDEFARGERGGLAAVRGFPLSTQAAHSS
jgi:hypothetical protein